VVQETRLVEIEVDKIRPNPDNPRTEVGDVTELANSIRESGLAEPLLVREDLRSKGYYILEDGERRWTAAKVVLQKVNCIVYKPRPDVNLLERTLTVGLITGSHNKSLSPLERAYACARLMDECDMTQTQVSRVTGIHESTVSRDLLLLQLTPKTQERVLSGQISIAEATRYIRQVNAEAKPRKGAKTKKRGAVDIPRNVDHWTKYHPLAAKAQNMCDARSHPQRGRTGSIACGRCWETVIRADQHEQDVIELRQSGFDVPFQPPIMTPTTPTNGTGKVKT
jgi:ParB family chromosome partitioning protein